jgi:hypothetical protein
MRVLDFSAKFIHSDDYLANYARDAHRNVCRSSYKVSDIFHLRLQLEYANTFLVKLPGYHENPFWGSRMLNADSQRDVAKRVGAFPQIFIGTASETEAEAEQKDQSTLLFKITSLKY